MLEDDLSRLRRVVTHGGSAMDVDAALAPLASAHSPSSIKPLLLMLNDESDDEGMWPLVHAAEAFDDETYVESFLAALPALIVASARWASIMMMRSLNSDPTRLQLTRQLRTAPRDVKQSALLLCDRISRVDARFLAKTAIVLAAAGE